MFDTYREYLPRTTNRFMKKIAGHYARVYLRHIRAAGIKEWKFGSFNRLKEQISNPLRTSGSRSGGTTSYGVEVARYLLALDNFKKQPHWVKLKKGRLIRQWAIDKMGTRPTGYLLKTQPDYEPSIPIKSHPWLESANAAAYKGIQQIIRIELNKLKDEVKAGV